MQIDGETVETVTDFTVLGSKITTDGDFSHKTKRCLLSLKVENLKEFDHFFLKLKKKTQHSKNEDHGIWSYQSSSGQLFSHV